ncbi:MAG: MarC family protein [Pseudomonadota bacterium]
MDISYFLKVFAALFAIASPVANLPVFLSLTSDHTPKARARVAIACCLGVLIGGAVVLVSGEAILALFGLEIAHFRLAGGLLILLIALEMVHGSQSKSHHGTASERADAPTNDPSIYPLTIPILLGPGTISTLILLQHSAEGTPQIIAVWVALCAATALLMTAFLSGTWLARQLSQSVTSVLGRLMGMILAAIGLEMMVESLSTLLPGLGA